MKFNLSRYNRTKEASLRKEISLLDLYPEGEREALEEYGPVNPAEAAAETKLFPEGDEIPDSLSELAQKIHEDPQRAGDRNTKNIRNPPNTGNRSRR